MPRTCVVTGATRGIGKAISDLLTTSGYEVVGLARHAPVEDRGRFIRCDVTDEQSIHAACDQVRSLGPVWALINNAGISAPDSIEGLALADLQQIFLANSLAPAMFVQAVVPGMTDGGRIVNIGSAAADGRAGRSGYSSSKAALAGLTRSWALELGPRGITVNLVSPGPIETELLRAQVPVGSDAEREQLAGIPVGRFGTADQVAKLVALLLDASMFSLSGQVIRLDGAASVGAR